MSLATGMKLFSSYAAGDAASSEYGIPVYGGPLRQVIAAVFCWATNFQGGTVTIQISPDGTNWFTARRVNEQQSQFTVSDVHMVHLRGRYIRAELTGTGASVTDLNVQVFM